jgi:thioredoxin-dependent peroxiredoxin
MSKLWILVLVIALALGWMALKQPPTASNSASAKALIAVGQPAPDFSATASPDGQVVRLSALKGQSVVLVFYPMDNTPGCTIQLCALRDAWGKLKSLNATALGINPGSLKSHQQFAQNQHYPYPLVVDENRAIAQSFGVGSTMNVNSRTVIIVDPQGIVRYVQEGLPPVKELMAVIEGFKTAPPSHPVAH